MMHREFPRDDPRHYTPGRLPREFAAFADPVQGLAIGRPGKVGLLEMTFARIDGRTRLTHHFQQTPLQIFRPLYVDPPRPDLAVLQIIATGGGILQGDRYRLDITCETGSAVHLTTQSATKLYRAEHNYATQILNLTAGPDTILEYLPDPIIPFRDARFFQRTTLTVDPSATVIIGETLLPGRVAHGERHAYTRFVSQTEALAPEGKLLFADTISLDPTTNPLNTPGRLGTHDVLGSMFIVSQRLRPRDLVLCLREALGPQSECLAGVSELPHGSGASARILGPTSITVQAAMRACWDAARRELLGVPAFDSRKA
jgi:urease accessory protein